ncbi:MAG: Xaa-Pro peptidase family protein [Thermofilaceae archaeon]
MVDFSTHLSRVRELLAEKGLNTLIVMGSSNIQYLIGSDAPSAAIVNFDDIVTLSSRLEFTRTLDEAKLGKHFTYLKEGEVAEYENAILGGFYDALKKLLEGAGKGRWGYAGLSQEARRRLEEELGSTGVDLTKDFLTLRRRKDPSEVEALRSAARVAERALAKAITMLETGITEAEVAAEITSCIMRCGCEPSFPPIVAFGEHSAHPHAKPSLRKLRRGDPVKIDLGARVDGYCSDLTRTLTYGGCDGKFQGKFWAVLKAQERAIEVIKPGVQAREVHMTAVETLRREKLLMYFNHGLGHGLGLDIHEEPYLNAEATTSLLPGDVVTVEPGIYVYGAFGIRVEDIVLVTEQGPEVLTSFPKFLTL